ncbi:FAD-binding oxidoreductase [Hasllibacter sp. MH4015]|uniref:NAD(P)/FAD-dependent oxidoreductase n=1 Tax=Hasllibacter sp. MH4015 TaxID=2854029 RepID=UPI001CD2E777|nr:FAD-binding oxidoreductase [Hasllibacter sp. MH4015]
MTRYVARRLPRLAGPAAWNEILGPAPAYPPLEGDITAEFVVVGAGFAGLSAAQRLTQLRPNARIVLLEATRIAEGAAGRNSGFMIDLPHDLTSADYKGAGDDAARIALNRQAIAFARDAVAEYGIKPDYFDEAGKVNGAASPAAEAHNQSYAAHLAGLGETFEHLDAKAMQDLTGSAHYHSGLFTPGTVMLQPAGYIRGLAAGLAQYVQVHERSPVISLKRQGSGWQVQVPAGTISAPRVILAVNGHLESFGFAKNRLMHVFLYASMSSVLPDGAIGGAARWGITPSDPMGTTLRRIDTGQGGNRIVTRTVATLRSDMKITTKDIARATAVQRKKFDARFPGFAGLMPEYEWAGGLCLSRNGVSVTGEIDAGLFAACVQNGLGTVRGTMTGIAAAEMACGESTAFTRHCAAEDAPTRLPPAPIRDIGGNAVIRYREWKARAE